MRRSLLASLACPACRADVEPEVLEGDATSIRTGTLHCARGCATYPITRGIPRFVTADAYTASFSRQRRYVRRHFAHYQTDTTSAGLLLQTTGFDPAALATGLTLEVGCGYGRFVDAIASLGGTVVGIDHSADSIELAAEWLGDRPGVHLVQADLFHAPFRPGTFDHVCSIGVLHHTPDTRRAFDAIVPFVRSHGQIAIWVYHPRNKVSANRWRVVTTRLPRRLLYGWCVTNQALFSWMRALPGGTRLNALIPGAAPTREASFWRRVMTDFDNLAPPYAHTHTPEDVRGWFREAGLTDVRVLPRDTAVIGRAP